MSVKQTLAMIVTRQLCMSANILKQSKDLFVFVDYLHLCVLYLDNPGQTEVMDGKWETNNMH